MIELAITAVAFFAAGYIVCDRVGACCFRREIERLEAVGNPPRALTLRERLAATEPEIKQERETA